MSVLHYRQKDIPRHEPQDSDTEITDQFWIDNYMGADGVCELCTNGNGKVEGGFCICPDGRALEKNAAKWLRMIAK